MGVSLTELLLREQIALLRIKLKQLKKKNAKKLRDTYDEIVSELLPKRYEAVRIVQAYKSELDRIIISDDDIEHLHNTVSHLLEIIKTFQLSFPTTKGERENAKVTAQEERYEKIKESISVDTLKTMQLIRFNYKAVIGDTLTQICANAISSIGTKEKSQSSNTHPKNKGR